MEQPKPAQEQEPPAYITEAQVQLAREIVAAPEDRELHTNTAVQSLFEQATAFNNLPVATALWQEVPLTFDNLSRWYDVNPDPVLLPRLYERLVSEELRKVDSDYINDEEKRRMSQHDRAAVRVATMMAEANHWDAVPPLFEKVHYNQPLFKALAEVAIAQGNKERMIELVQLETEHKLGFSPWGAIKGVVNSDKAVEQLASVGVPELTPFAESIKEYREIARNANFHEILEKGYATIALAEFMGEPLTADIERDQTNWSRAFRQIGREIESFLVTLRNEQIDFAPYLEPIAKLYADTQSWQAIYLGLLEFRGVRNGMALPDDKFHEAFVPKLIELLAETEFAEKAMAVQQKYIEESTKYPHSNGVIERLWDPEKMVIEPRQSVRSHLLYETEETIHKMKDLSVEEVLEIQDPTARANGLLHYIIHEGQIELINQANEAIKAIFDPQQRFVHQYILLNHTI